jgi:hypothetical protein
MAFYSESAALPVHANAAVRPYHNQPIICVLDWVVYDVEQHRADAVLANMLEFIEMTGPEPSVHLAYFSLLA